jgi:glycosyltransferase involved in cell wall biosynthesis
MTREPFEGTPVNAEEVLFVGIGTSPVFYYRCLLPATAMGCDYAGVMGDPSSMAMATGHVRHMDGRLPDFEKYRVVILQQPKGRAWQQRIAELQSKGIRVLYEVDDYLDGVKDQVDHGARHAYGPSVLAEYASCMRAADGLIVSTPKLAELYRDRNERIWVCRNGIDPRRYAYTVPADGTVNVVFAGGTGHLEAAKPWLAALARVMMKRPEVRFTSIGATFGVEFQRKFGEHRAAALPWLPIEAYPVALAAGDIALGPIGDTPWSRAKSDLRWLEASCAGAAFIGSEWVYTDVLGGVTGYVVPDATRVETLLLDLVDRPGAREAMALAAQRDVARRRTIESARKMWERVIVEVAAP